MVFIESSHELFYPPIPEETIFVQERSSIKTASEGSRNAIVKKQALKISEAIAENFSLRAL
jgi:hypothetical protein